MLATLASDTVIDAAYQWLCHQRRHWAAGTDIWDFRFHWPDEKTLIQQTQHHLITRSGVIPMGLL
jgi:hypothetical protein